MALRMSAGGSARTSERSADLLYTAASKWDGSARIIALIACDGVGRIGPEHPAGKVISADTIDPVRLDGRGFTLRADAAARTLAFTIPDQPRASEIVVAHR